MFNRFKEKVNFKKAIITLICLVFGLSCASLFAFISQNNTAQPQAVSTSANVSNQTELDPNSLVLNYGKKHTQNKVQLVSDSTGETTYYGSYHYTLKNVTSIPYNTTIHFRKANNTDTDKITECASDCTDACSGVHYVIEFVDVGYALVHIHNGYEFEKIESGYLNNGNIVVNRTYSGGAAILATTELLDPGYTGNLVFKTSCKEVIYTLQAYYTDAEDESIRTLDLGTYSHSIELDLTTEAIMQTLSNTAGDNRVFDFLCFNNSVAANYGSMVLDSSTGRYTYTTSNGVNLNIAMSGNNGSSTYYVPRSIKGCGVLPQSGDNQIVFIAYKNKYNVKVSLNAGDSWAHLDDNERITKVGVVSCDADGNRTESLDSTYITVANTIQYSEYRLMSSYKDTSVTSSKDTMTSFYNGTSVADIDGTLLSFCSKEEFEELEAREETGDGSYYYVYNYGYYISKWEIYFNNEKKYTDTLVSSATDNPTFPSLFREIKYYANLADESVLGGVKVEIEIKPVWEEIKIQARVKDSTTNLARDEFDFASRYILDESRFTRSEGQSIVATTYNSTNEDALISLNGCWNYSSIPYTCFEDIVAEYDVEKRLSTLQQPGMPTRYETIYTRTSFYAIIYLEPIYVDDIFKVNLNLGENVGNTYSITAGDYKFNMVSPSSYEELTYSYNSYNGFTPITYNQTTYPYVDDFIVALKSNIEEYKNGIAGDFDILRTVYASSGELLSDKELVFDSSASADDKSIWIYLANNQPTGNLPVFEIPYNTLIFWQNEYDENCKASEAEGYTLPYIYKTSAFDSNQHEQELKDGEDYIYKTRTNDIWCYSDGHNTDTTCQLNAYFYRKVYNLDIGTYFNGNLERRGYILLQINDQTYAIGDTTVDKGGNYVLIKDASSNKMLTYKVISDISSYDSFGLTTATLQLMAEDLLLYSGCNLLMAVKDQSQDVQLMKSGNYDEMIGYRFAGTLTQTPTGNPLYTSDNCEDIYAYVISAAEIEQRGYSNREDITIQVNFEKIKYNFTMTINDVNAGEFKVDIGDITSGYRTSYSIDEILVNEKTFIIDYYAYAGYKLNNASFTLSNGATLQTYDDTISNVDQQKYIITGLLDGDNKLDGTWLRENFYNISDLRFKTDDVSLGILYINTYPIEFNYGVKIYDPTDATKAGDNYIVETVADGTLSLASAGKVTTNSAGYYLNETSAGWIYTATNSTDYALLNSRLYYPKNFTTTSRNLYTVYDFLLNTQPTNQHTLTSSYIANMVTNHQDGVIIAPTDRNLYIMLEVRKLYEINMSVEEYSAIVDTNSTTRTSTLSSKTNNKNYTVNIVTEANSDYLNSVVAYTYHGLTNNLTSAYDNKRYTGVEYYLNGAKLDSASFEGLEDKNLVIKYIPKTLNIEYVYMKDGSTLSSSESSNYITETRPANLNYTLGTSFTYSAECIHSDYNMSVTINGNNLGSTNNIERIVSGQYAVVDSDYNFGKIQIVVDIYEKDNSQITVMYQLKNVSQKRDGDNYGTLTVYEDGIEETGCVDVEVANTNIITGRQVDVEINLPVGYRYSSYVKHSTYDSEQIVLSGGKITLVREFDPEVDGGTYIILIEKIDISARLNVAGLNAEYYINGKTALSNLYVGDSIEFTNVDIGSERLDYFYYYKDSNSNNVCDEGEAVWNITEDNNPLLITSGLLSDIGSTIILFGVNVVERYNLILDVIGAEYLKENGLQLTNNVIGEEYISRTYCDVGTTINLSAESLESNKYLISLVGDDHNLESQEILSDITIILNSDKQYILTIEPRVYAVELDENVYITLEQVEAENPSDETAPVSSLLKSGQSYLDTAILEFNRVVPDASDVDGRQLATIIISGNGGEHNLIIKFTGVNYMAYVDNGEDTELINLTDYGYSIAVTNYGTVRLTYITQDDISIRLDYKLYKIINVA